VFSVLLNNRRKSLLEKQNITLESWRGKTFRNGAYAGRCWGEMIDSNDLGQITYMQRWVERPEFMLQIQNDVEVLVDIEDALEKAKKEASQAMQRKKAAARKRRSQPKRNAKRSKKKTMEMDSEE
jgi:hypothetical protein